MLLHGISGFRASFEGEQREQADAVAAIQRGFIIALFLIFTLLAIPFRSYTQPLIIMAAKVRFRPILLTSLTTFLGVLPLILERSLQAQFLIPIAASLGFGILFATFIILVLVPALVILEDRVRYHVLRLLGKDTSRFEYDHNAASSETASSTGSSLGSEPVAT